MAIYFHKSLYERALKAIKESEELADVSRDLEKVSHQMEQVEYSNLISIGDPNGQQWLLQQERELDDALRKNIQ